jgi:DivIVA domain-containing protein
MDRLPEAVELTRVEAVRLLTEDAAKKRRPTSRARGDEHQVFASLGHHWSPLARKVIASFTSPEEDRKVRNPFGGFSMSDLDLPRQPNAEQIRRREFASVRRGYDPDQVRDYLNAIAATLESLERDVRENQRELQELRSQAPAAEATPSPEPAAPAADPYETFAKKLAGLLAAADQEALRLVKEAKVESKRIIEESRSEAARIRVHADASAEEARLEGDHVLHEARAEAETALAGLASRRKILVDQLQTMQSRLLQAADSLKVVMEEDDAATPVAGEEAKGPGQVADSELDEPLAEPEQMPGERSLELPDFDGIEFDFDADDRPSDE